MPLELWLFVTGWLVENGLWVAKGMAPAALAEVLP